MTAILAALISKSVEENAKAIGVLFATGTAMITFASLVVGRLVAKPVRNWLTGVIGPVVEPLRLELAAMREANAKALEGIKAAQRQLRAAEDERWAQHEVHHAQVETALSERMKTQEGQHVQLASVVKELDSKVDTLIGGMK